MANVGYREGRPSNYHNAGTAAMSDNSINDTGSASVDLQKEIVALSELITMYPKRHDYYVARGDGHWLRHKHNMAIADYSLAIERNPQNAALRHRLATMYLDLGRIKEATMYFLDLTIDEPSSHRAQYGLALCYSEVGDFENANLCFANAIRLSANDPSYLARRGRLYHDHGYFAESIAEFEKATSSDPYSAQYWGGLAYAKVCGIDSWRSAIHDLNRALSLASQDVWDHWLRAHVHFLQLDFDRALTDYLFVTIHDDTGDLYESHIWVHLSLAFLNRRKEGIDYLGRQLLQARDKNVGTFDTRLWIIHVARAMTQEKSTVEASDVANLEGEGIPGRTLAYVRFLEAINLISMADLDGPRQLSRIAAPSRDALLFALVEIAKATWCKE